MGTLREIAAQVAFEMLGGESADGEEFPPNDGLQTLFDKLEGSLNTIIVGAQSNIAQHVDRALASHFTKVADRVILAIDSRVEYRDVGKERIRRLEQQCVELRGREHALIKERDIALADCKLATEQAAYANGHAQKLHRALAVVALRLGVLKNGIPHTGISPTHIQERDSLLLSDPDLLGKTLDEEVARIMREANISSASYPSPF